MHGIYRRKRLSTTTTKQNLSKWQTNKSFRFSEFRNLILTFFFSFVLSVGHVIAADGASDKTDFEQTLKMEEFFFMNCSDSFRIQTFALLWFKYYNCSNGIRNSSKIFLFIFYKICLSKNLNTDSNLKYISTIRLTRIVICLLVVVVRRFLGCVGVAQFAFLQNESIQLFVDAIIALLS